VQWQDTPLAFLARAKTLHIQQRHRVLLVDDDDAVLSMMRESLELKGFEIVAVGGVAEALKRITPRALWRSSVRAACRTCDNQRMCGRYRLSRRKQILEEHFDSVSGEEDWSPRYNIAPTQPVPVIRQNPRQAVRELSLLRWGLVPSWGRDISMAASMINAWSETASSKPAFREALQSRRCLIPADGFYEWQRTGKTKQPYCFEVSDGQLFAFAGIWDRWQDARGKALETCAILTTTANGLTSTIHDRMPVILERDNYDLWLDPGMKNASAVSDLLKPYDARLMRSFPVSSRVNHVDNDDEACSAPVEVMQDQASLF
jgi:putative SOS response-associated peptidase YedK